MAIYHLHAKVIKRSEGKSAVRSAAYRHATMLFDERLLRTWGYSNKENVVCGEIIVPEDAPAWAKDLVELYKTNSDAALEKFWNMIEAHEMRVDSQLAREFDIGFPIELTQAQAIALGREFLKDQFALRGMIADMSVHWEPENPHMHVMVTMRELTQEGFGLKVPDWNKKSLLFEWRKQWAERIRTKTSIT